MPHFECGALSDELLIVGRAEFAVLQGATGLGHRQKASVDAGPDALLWRRAVPSSCTITSNYEAKNADNAICWL